MKSLATLVKTSFVVAAILNLVSCGGGGDNTVPTSGGGSVASFQNPTRFSVEEQLNPVDSVFGSVNTNFYSLNGSPLESASRLVGTNNYIGSVAFRESGTGTLFSGSYRMTFSHSTGTGTGQFESLSVSHSNSESRFIDGTLRIVLTNLDGANYAGQVTGALTETGLSARAGLVYNIDGTIQGSLVSATVDFLDGTRTLGVLDGTVIRSTGESSPASGLFYANY